MVRFTRTYDKFNRVSGDECCSDKGKFGEVARSGTVRDGRYGTLGCREEER